MAGNARYTALVDACAFFPVAIADSLISLAAAGLYAAKWTAAIEVEWMRGLESQRPDLVGKLEYRRDSMRRAVPDWEVAEEAWGAHAPGLKLPDRGDVHVLAAAIAGHADCIVTTNLKDFPGAVLDPFGINVVHPDEFIVAQLDLDQLIALAAFKRMRARRQRLKSHRKFSLTRWSAMGWSRPRYD
jgi:hypothetical protein